MKAIILNSGLGTRLEELTEHKPKTLVKLYDDESIFSRAINILSQFDIDEFIITTGYLNRVLIQYCDIIFPDINFNFVHNPVYDKTNYIKSLDLIGDIDDDIILLHGDLVFDYLAAERIINSNTSCVVVDSTVSLPKDDFKAKIHNNYVEYIGVDYFGEDAVSCQPFYKLKNRDWKVWKNNIHEFCISNQINVYAENALNEITDKLKLKPLDMSGLLCMEVDNKKDLEKVRSILKNK